MKEKWAARSLFLAGWLVVVGVGMSFAELPSTKASAWNELRGQTPSALSQISATNDQRSDLFRQAPTLSRRLRVSEQTLIPYVGAGFGGGYVTERDRALSPQPILPQQNLFGESLGKGMMPNEFQMGIRIPF
jgi:hypothetical protein